MIRCHIGLIVLVLVLTAGIGATLFMSHIPSNICHDLDQAVHHASASDLETANPHILSAQKSWEQHRQLIASLAEHTDMDFIDELFRELNVYQALRDAPACAVICAQLAYRIEALGESHNINWWNLL